MTSISQGDGDTQNPPTPPEGDQGVTVVGYADQGLTAPEPTIPGLAQVKSSVSSVRVLSVLTLLAVLVIGIASVITIAMLSSQVTTLSAQLEKVSSKQGELATLAQGAGEQATAQGSGTLDDSATSGEGVAAVAFPAAPVLPEQLVTPAGIDEAGAIVLGDPNASNVVEVYIDYQCPFCQRWEAQIGETLAYVAQQEGSDVVLKQYNLAFLGEQNASLDPPGASARAAAAAACVLEGEGPEIFTLFNTEIFRSADPSEPPSQFSVEVMNELAASLGASPETLACINDLRHVPFVAVSTLAGFERGVQGTPTVILNDRLLENAYEDSELLSLVTQQ